MEMGGEILNKLHSRIPYYKVSRSNGLECFPGGLKDIGIICIEKAYQSACTLLPYYVRCFMHFDTCATYKKICTEKRKIR